MTQQELSALANEVKQLEGARTQIDERAASIGLALMEAYPIDERPERVGALLNEIDDLL